MKRGLENKAQISIFIIISILILVVIGIFFIVKSDILNLEKEKINPEFMPVYNFVQECIKSTGEDAVYHIGQTGGYIIPELSSPFSIRLDNESDADIAYYFYNQQNQMPSKEQIEKELSDYMEDFIGFCTNDFVSFPDFEIDYGKVKSDAKIEDNKVIFDVEFPISVKKEEKTGEFSEFSGEIFVRLDKIYETAEKIIERQIQDKNEICLSCLYDIADENEMNIQILESFNKTLVFVIRDEKSKIYGGDYLFYFANKYE